MQIQVHFHLHGAVCYNIYTQARIPIVLCAIHNFICIHDGNEDLVLGQDNGEAYNEDRFGGLQGRHRRKMHKMPSQMVHYKWYMNFVTKSLNTCGKTVSILFMRVAMMMFHSTLKMRA